jgi:hypothetical protein
MAPRVPPPSVTLTFQGKRDWPLEDVIDDWGLTPQQQASAMPRSLVLRLFRPDASHSICFIGLAGVVC